MPEEQKRCSKGSRGTNDLLYIDGAVFKEVKSRNKNLAMAWIDYKKAYDMVTHLWMIEFLDLFGVPENIKSLLVNSMEKWKVVLCSGNSELGEVGIKQGIFQGDSLSPLVFVLALINICVSISVSIELPNGTVIKSLQEGESYRYLRMSEADKYLIREDEVECFKGIY